MDSTYSRGQNNKAGHGRTKGLGGKEIQKILGIEDEERKSLLDKNPISVMDIIIQAWEAEDEELDGNSKPY